MNRPTHGFNHDLAEVHGWKASGGRVWTGAQHDLAASAKAIDSVAKATLAGVSTHDEGSPKASPSG
jgi:hypothetical protein